MVPCGRFGDTPSGCPNGDLPVSSLDPGGFEARESCASRLSKAVSWTRRLSSFRGADCPRLRKKTAGHDVEGRGSYQPPPIDDAHLN
jgi:hypothetical protein